MDGFQSAPFEPAPAAAPWPAEALARAVLDRAAPGFIGLDAGLNVILCNRAAAGMLGCACPETWHPVPLPTCLDGCLGLDAPGRHMLRSAIQAAFAVPFPATRGSTVRLTMRDACPIDVSVDRIDHGHCLLTLATAPEPGALPPERADALTGLSDRQWFRERLAAALAGPDGEGHAAILLIDLDRFKAVNDSLGHPAGDALLQMVSKRLAAAVRDVDLVSRLGGDEFAVLMHATSAPEATAQRLVDLLSRPYLIEGQVAVIGASIGVALGPRDGADATALIRAADLALYQAKADGRQTVRLFDRAMDSRARARHALIDDLRRALALQQFQVHYQPQTNLVSRQLVGFEALIRWHHPTQGLIPPDRFIPLAEEMGLIVGIGEWVLRTACRDAMTWPDQLAIAVNVSARQLEDPDRLPRAVAAALAASGLPARRLEIEITESALVRHEKQALQVLHALRAKGVRVSMDDFGTGYSSLSQLRSFPFDKLKIDRSFVRDLSSSEEAVAVIRAIAALGASLGMTTTAEGVETDAQAAMVRDDGCTDMQGYLVSRPVPAAEVAALIQTLATPPALTQETAP